ncbi:MULTISPECIES: hypothetical protein [Clostridium]|uniref:Uncharacterized protein n=1 Tax=Candidatus Clostridium helianthi TaxID=3381660 RepID=A0ABW8SC44_9CLOT|nr:hypothetical protein [Clostridium beijerinckii]MZK53491.1 hypothetical protein [Clostridium beijerinckii]MZK61629.1 hypothetical protein [Clostridium beijerinckii]MZK71854.1 hypothetical protein [Clostridium beijerinckii]MZK77258.1 hypothetical protein [Clostridium beijerinckii]MZK86337.1 hypothetical protein [Clostridium beijerinckii]
MGDIINLIISIKASDIYLDDMTGTLTIEAAVKEAQRKMQRSLNKVKGLHEIIKCLRGEDDD